MYEVHAQLHALVGRREEAVTTSQWLACQALRALFWLVTLGKRVSTQDAYDAFCGDWRRQ